MFIFKLQSQNISEIGSKAWNLLKLEKAGFRVPPGLVLTAQFIDWHKADLARQLVQHCIAMPRGNFAVRSSGVQEDLAQASFAGQYKTLLDVKMAEIEKAVLDVTNNSDTTGLNLYRKQSNQTKDKSFNLKPSVLIQPMLYADVSGIAFSVHPSTGEVASFISCIKGVGEKLASGELSGQTYKFKKVATRIDESKEKDNLTSNQLKEIDRLARKVSRYFGSPQDIEWAYVGRKLYLLQARPITTINKQIFDNSNIAESYPGITLPLTFSLARKAYANVYYTFMQLLKVSPEKIERNQEIFAQMLAYIKGRIYYNMVSWYRLVSLLPGYQANKTFMEQMMGVQERSSAKAKVSIASSIKDNLNLILCAFALIFYYITLDKSVSKFKNRLESTLDTAKVNLDDKSIFECVSLYLEVENKLLKHWDAPILNDFFTMVSFGLLKGFCKNDSYNQLLAGRYKSSSSEPVELLNEMASMITQQESVQFKQKFQEYLDKYGDRCAGELKLENPTLKDNPAVLLDAIVALSRKTNRNSVSAKADLKQYESNFVKRIILKLLLDAAARHITLRESMRIDRMRVFALVRRVFLAIAEKLVAQNVLEAKTDIFYLEIDEVIQYINGTSTVQNLNALVELRKQEIDSFRAINPRVHIETSTCIAWHEDIAESQISLCQSNLMGTGC
jgi:pyruvate,water dikinase